jgi:hypothetical protein
VNFWEKYLLRSVMRICCKEYSMEMELLALKRKLEQGTFSEKEKEIIEKRIKEIEKKLGM